MKSRLRGSEDMAMTRISRRSPRRYTRRSFLVDDGAIRRARRALGVQTNAEAVRVSIERVVEMERFWRFMRRSRARLDPGDIEVA
jgi:hypothetical protein